MTVLAVKSAIDLEERLSSNLKTRKFFYQIKIEHELGYTIEPE
jgi:hypothetical protein